MSSRFGSKTRMHALPRTVHPPSPPDTESDSLGLTQNFTPDMTLVGIETPAERFRRTSALAYKTSSSSQREQQRPVLKSFKWLLLVLPPSSLPQEPTLGSTLSTSPPGRLSSGTLMPLFPTLYAQLAAIAREYGMPSTVGLCVYLHMADNGINFTPRLSDEAWPIVWAQYFTSDSFERPTGSLMQPPISGRIEFDIDIRKAKWYTSWAIGHIRQLSDETYGGSDRRSLFDGDDRDAADSDMGIAKTAPSFSTIRQPPRRLSLLTRREMDLPLIKAPRTPSRLAQFEVESTSSRLTGGPEKGTLHKLSPVPQAEEPTTATQRDVTAFVQQWRAGNTPTAPPNVPPSPGQETLKSRVPAETESSAMMTSPVLDLAGFAWSVSSHGPPSPLSSSTLELAPRMRHRDATPDLGERMLEDAPNTPNTATTWGPPSEYPETPSSVDRLPSPDMGQRVMENSALTPTTATSWGPPSEYPETPSSIDRLPSPDIGQRVMEYSALTPTTATTWGAPLSYPPSPTTEIEWVPTPDVAHRVFSPTMPPLPTYTGQTLDIPVRPEDDGVVRSPASKSWDVVRQAVKNGVPFRHVWPYNARKPSTSSHDNQVLDIPALPEDDGAVRSPASKSWDVVRQAVKNGVPFQHVWPYNARKPSTSSHDSQTLDIPVRPEDNGVIRSPASKSWDVVRQAVKDGIPFRHVWPYNARKPSVRDRAISTLDPIVVQLVSSYPTLDIYPAAYPHFDIYPAVHSKHHSNPVLSFMGQSLPVALPPSYPNLQIYKPAYPHLEIYPAVHPSWRKDNGSSEIASSRSLPVRLPPIYPSFDIYGTGYPEFLIYPPVVLSKPSTVTPSSLSKELSVRLPPAYPSFDIYGSAYPDLVIYPSVALPKSLTVASSLVHKALSVRLPPAYPSFDIYGSAYPDLVIYPSVALPKSLTVTSSLVHKALSVRLPPAYPSFDIYGSAYPELLVYPPVSLSKPLSTASLGLQNSLSVRLPPVYPSFNIYGSAYPSLEIYPAVHLTPADLTPIQGNSAHKELSVTLPTVYPAFSLYLPCYPNFEIYPTISSLVQINPVYLPNSSSTFSRATPFSGYPHFNIYPAVYPFVEPYPVMASLNPSKREHTTLTYTPLMSNDELVSAKVTADDVAINETTPKIKMTADTDRELALSKSYSRTNPIHPLTPRSRSGSIASPEDSERSRKELHDLIFGFQDPQTSMSGDSPTPVHPPLHRVSPTARLSRTQLPPVVDHEPSMPKDAIILETTAPLRSRSRSSTISRPGAVSVGVSRPPIIRKPSLSAKQPPFPGRVADTVILEEVTPDGQRGPPITTSTRHVLDFMANQSVDTPSKVARSRTWSPTHSLSPVSPRFDGQGDQTSPKSPGRVKSSAYIQQRQALFNSHTGNSPTTKPQRQSSHAPSRPVSRLDLSKYSFQ